jgi:Beta-lactamase class C and other penicillin binding proteins
LAPRICLLVARASGRRAQLVSKMKKKTIKIVVCIGLLIVCISACSTYPFRTAIKSKSEIINGEKALDIYVARLQKLFSVEKIQLAIFADNEILYKQEYHSDEKEQFQAASNSKPVVAYTALKMVENGLLTLDTPLSNYTKVRYFEDDNRGDQITLRMILNHTSGMGNSVGKSLFKIYMEPGKEFHYSGAGFEYLRIVIETITGKSLDKLIQEIVFTPLKMTNSSYIKMKINGEYAFSAAGGLLTTAEDLGKFYCELVNPQHIRSDLINEMLSDSSRINANNSWGLGIGIQSGNGERIIWHSGNNGNKWIALSYASVSKKIGIIILCKGKNGYYINQWIIHKAIGGPNYGLSHVLNNTNLK